MIQAFRRSPYDREIFRIGIPALGALAADPLVSLVDTAFIGRLGAVALASVAIASAIFAAVFAVFNFLEYSVTPLVAQSIGAGDRAEAGRFTVAALAISAVGGVIAAVGLVVFSDPLLRAFGASADVIESAGRPIRTISRSYGLRRNASIMDRFCPGTGNDRRAGNRGNEASSRRTCLARTG